jgi:hypothetical protein
MPSQTSDVGALTLPLAAGRPKDAIVDPVVEALLDFLSFSLNDALNTKLGSMNGFSEQAVPPGNRYAFDPTEPQGHKARFRLPSLFMWWDGKSQWWEWSQLQDARRRFISLLYVFEEPPGRDALELRRGLFAAVDSTLLKAAQRGYHSSYAYNGAAPGTMLINSLGDYGTWAWDYMGGQGIQRIGIGDSNTSNFGMREPTSRDAGRSRPAFAARFMVEELVQAEQKVYPDDLLQDSPADIQHNGAPLLSRVLGAPDGSNAPPNC